MILFLSRLSRFELEFFSPAIVVLVVLGLVLNDCDVIEGRAPAKVKVTGDPAPDCWSFCRSGVMSGGVGMAGPGEALWSLVSPPVCGDKAPSLVLLLSSVSIA